MVENLNVFQGACSSMAAAAAAAGAAGAAVARQAAAMFFSLVTLRQGVFAAFIYLHSGAHGGADIRNPFFAKLQGAIKPDSKLA